MEQPLQHHGGRLEHNETYCGSCFGAQEVCVFSCMIKFHLWLCLQLHYCLFFIAWRTFWLQYMNLFSIVHFCSEICNLPFCEYASLFLTFLWKEDFMSVWYQLVYHVKTIIIWSFDVNNSPFYQSYSHMD